MVISSEETSIQTAAAESEASILREASSCYENLDVWMRND